MTRTRVRTPGYTTLRDTALNLESVMAPPAKERRAPHTRELPKTQSKCDKSFIQSPHRSKREYKEFRSDGVESEGKRN